MSENHPAGRTWLLASVHVAKLLEAIRPEDYTPPAEYDPNVVPFSRPHPKGATSAARMISLAGPHIRKA